MWLSRSLITLCYAIDDDCDGFTDEGLTAPVGEHMQRHTTALAACFKSDDHREGVASFLERGLREHLLDEQRVALGQPSNWARQVPKLQKVAKNSWYFQ